MMTSTPLLGPTSETIIRLPEPSPTHATCAWCGIRLSTIVELIDHVDAGHLSGDRSAA